MYYIIHAIYRYICIQKLSTILDKGLRMNNKKRDKRGRDRAPSREGSLKKREVSKHQETLSLPSLGSTEGNITGRKNKQLKLTDYELNRARQAPYHLSCSDLGRAQNAGPTESAPLWSTREPEPEQLRPGKRTQPRACL